MFDIPKSSTRLISIQANVKSLRHKRSRQNKQEFLQFIVFFDYRTPFSSFRKETLHQN